jgi:cysteine desulfurase/selenocysteine lyase
MAPENHAHYPLITNHSELVYWDSAATTPAPRPVIEAQRVWIERQHANVHRGQYELAVKSTAAIEKIRTQTQRWLKAPADWTVIFNSGATAGLNTVASGLDEQIVDNDSIVVTADAHHSLFVPLQQLARRRKARFVVIGIDEQGQLDDEAWGEAIARRPKIVGLPQVSNVTGRIHNIDLLGAQAQAAGAFVITDAAQAVAHLDISLQDLPTDAYIFSAHKMYGPTGVGVLAISPRLASVLTPYTFGGGMIDRVDADGSTWANLPDKLEAGTPNLWGIAAFGATLTWLEHQRPEIIEHDQTIMQAALDQLGRVPGLKLYGPSTTVDRIPLFSFNIAGLHAHDVAEVIGQNGVAVRAGHHCAQPLHRAWDVPATVRASAGHYTTLQDVERLRQAINEAIKTLSHGR